MLLDKVVSSGCICRLKTNLFNSLCRTVDTCPAVPRVTTNYKKLTFMQKVLKYMYLQPGHTMKLLDN